jgi:choline dehydrogenase-like flavoprotein
VSIGCVCREPVILVNSRRREPAILDLPAQVCGPGTNPRKDPYNAQPEFHWTRLRAVGGRTNTWGQGCVRFGPADFKTKSIQGFGEDWPLGYDDLAPFYAKVERLIGIAGQKADYENAPDDVYLPPLPPRCIPQVRFRAGHKANDLAMMENMYGWMEQILRSCDAEIVPHRKYLEPMGDATHECGSVRMGAHPKTNALNSYCQSHDVKNLLVTDGSSFVSLPGTNRITLTIMALAWRASEHLAGLFQRREV